MRWSEGKALKQTNEREKFFVLGREISRAHFNAADDSAKNSTAEIERSAGETKSALKARLCRKEKTGLLLVKIEAIIRAAQLLDFTLFLRVMFFYGSGADPR